METRVGDLERKMGGLEMRVWDLEMRVRDLEKTIEKMDKKLGIQVDEGIWQNVRVEFGILYASLPKVAAH